MRSLYFLILLSTILSLSACASAGTRTEAPTEVVTAESGQVTSLAVGQALLVTLQANPTTGFNWKITQLPDFLEQTGNEEYVQDTPQSGKVGSGGVSSWKFLAKASGSGTLRFAYQRQWEKGVPPAKTAEYRLTVSR